MKHRFKLAIVLTLLLCVGFILSQGPTPNRFDKQFTLLVAEILNITTDSIPATLVGEPYSTTLEAVGGFPPYTWSIVLGALPAGITLDSATGILSGTPTVTGTFNFTVRVTDSP